MHNDNKSPETVGAIRRVELVGSVELRANEGSDPALGDDWDTKERGETMFPNSVRVSKSPFLVLLCNEKTETAIFSNHMGI